MTALQAELRELEAAVENMRTQSINNSVTAHAEAEAKAQATVDSYRDEMEALRHKNSQLEGMHARLRREKDSAVNEMERITVRK